MRLLDKEISGFMKLDTNDLAAQMNDAFDGKKENWRDKLANIQSKGKNKKVVTDPKEERMNAILNEAAQMGLQKDLDPILEESKGQEIVPYKPNQSLSEQRKIKNDELKKKVKMMQAINADTISQISSISSRDEKFFITGAKTNNKAKFVGQSKAPDEPGSPTARAAQALAIMNKTDDKELEDEYGDEVKPMYRNIGEQAFDEVSQLEKEMGLMFKDLNELEDRIKENKDLNEMQNLMKTTNQAMQFHINSYETLKNSIMLIN